MDDDDDEMGHLYTGLCDTRGLARTMLEDWEINHAVEDNDIGKATPNQHLRRNIKRFQLRTQPEIPTRSKRSNLRVRIYK